MVPVGFMVAMSAMVMVLPLGASNTVLPSGLMFILWLNMLWGVGMMPLTSPVRASITRWKFFRSDPTSRVRPSGVTWPRSQQVPGS